MKTAIVGSGAMGQLFGARMAMSGVDVVFLDANPRTVEALNSKGITLRTDLGIEHTAVSAAQAADITGTFELFVVFTKGFHTQSAVDSIRHLMGPDSYGLTLQNGLGNTEVLEHAFGRDRTLLGITDFPADMEEPGTIASSSQGKVRLGSLSEVPRLHEIADLLDRAGLNASVADDVRAPIWEKVAFNAALNTLSAVTAMSVGQIGADAHARRIVSMVLEETFAVAESQGIGPSRQHVDDALGNAFAHHADHKTSMLLDREAGRPTEVESIGGAIVRLGAEKGVPTPVLDTLCELLRSVSAPAIRR